MSDDDHATRTKQQLSEWGFGESVDAQETLAAVRRFIDWISENLQPTAWLPEHPVTHVLASGQVVSGFIDLLLETKNGWVIIDHKATPVNLHPKLPQDLHRKLPHPESLIMAHI
jgi:ATP-dependent exoDNAse (exonuclease V) beta subunit